MREMSLGLLVWLALSDVAAVAGGAGLDVALGDDLRVVEVVPGVYRHISWQETSEFGRVPANGLIVSSSESAALIDTPWTDEQTARLFDWAERELGIEIDLVVVTHSHGDCMGGLGEAHRRGADSWALEMTAELARASGNPLPRHTFQERQQITVGTVDIELRYFGGGHTRDNIVAWMPQLDVLFGGCLVKREGGTAGYTGEADLAAWPETVRKLMEAIPEDALVVPGHGQPGGREYLLYTVELAERLLRERQE